MISCTIYCLSDPDTNEIRYVGKTIQKSKARYWSHISSAKKRTKKDHCHCWIRSLLDKDKLPKYIILEEDVDITRESYWIQYYIELGSSLTNHSSGGELGPIGARWKLNPEVVAAISEKRKKAIWQYSLNGVFIREWPSAIDFSRAHNLSDGVAANSITKGCACAGYILAMKGNLPNRKTRNYNKKVEVVTVNGVEEYFNAKIASEKHSINYSTFCYYARLNKYFESKKITIRYKDDKLS